MSRSKKSYDVMTFLICANIMGSLAFTIFPAALGAYTVDDFYTAMAVKLLVSTLSGLIIAALATLIVPGGERAVVYAFYGATFIFMWQSLTSVIAAVEKQMNVNFPLYNLVFAIGIFLMIITMFSFAGADVER